MTILDKEILERLAQQEKEEGNPPSIMKFYRDLLFLQSETRNCLSSIPPTLNREAARERLQHEVPLLSFDQLAPDWSSLAGVFKKVVAVFAHYPELFGKIPTEIIGTKVDDYFNQQTARTWYEDGKLPRVEGVNEGLYDTIVQATLRPFLTSHAPALAGLIEQEHWRRGNCPVCGGSPDFAFLDKEHGARWLICSRCDTDWLFQRLECPYCGTRDQNALSFFTDNEGLYRLYVCERCRRYLKAIDLRQAKSEVLLPLERLLTLDMDLQARGNGYTLGTKVTEQA